MILATHGILANAVPSSTLNTNLYAVYKAESNANDSLGVYNGTATGGLTYSAGKFGNAFTFNGSNAGVSLPNNSLNLTGNYSVSYWVYFASDPSGITPYILHSWNASTNVGMEYRIRTGKPEINYYVNGGLFTSWYNSGVLITTSGWYHLAFTHAGGAAPKFYYNGVLKTSGIRVSNATVYEASYTSPSICSIGYNNQTLTNYMPNNSKIDELNIWNKELTAAEITELYNSGSGKFYPY